MNNYKKEFNFIDAKKHRANIEAEITDRNGYPEFTASGEYCGSAGQCLDAIEPRTEEQRAFIGLWNNYHLKNISEVSIEGKTFFDYLIQLIASIEAEQAIYNDRREDAEEELTEDEKLLEQIEEYGINESDIDACRAYLEAMGSGTDLSDFLESYQGEYRSDKDFAQETAESCGLINEGAGWPNNCIDWEQAARELMYDYTEQSGFYFRNL
ncbi:hypothetical protein HGB13_00130 [bacterium]|nr:hypothetical protein [bacterium]